MPAATFPFCDVAHVHNFRDIACSAIVQRGLVFRSAVPSRLTPEGLATLRSLGVQSVFDLRSKPETDRDPVELPGRTDQDESNHKAYGLERIWTPVFAEEEFTPEKIALKFKEYAGRGTEGVARAYEQILEHGTSAFRTILLYLAGPVPGAAQSAAGVTTVDYSGRPAPCLIHCTAGKDRTGVIVAIVLSLLGVDDDTIASEYNLTEVGIANVKDAMKERVMKNKSFQQPEGTKGAEDLLSAKKENMLATLEMLRTRYGGAEGYVQQKCGLSDSEIERMRANLTARPNQLDTSISLQASGRL